MLCLLRCVLAVGARGKLLLGPTVGCSISICCLAWVAEGEGGGNPRSRRGWFNIGEVTVGVLLSYNIQRDVTFQRTR